MLDSLEKRIISSQIGTNCECMAMDVRQKLGAAPAFDHNTAILLPYLAKFAGLVV
jgi:hypothetical protein